MPLDTEVLLGVLTFAGAIILALAGLLVRERRRTDAGNPGSSRCKWQPAGTLTLSHDTMKVFTGEFAALKSELQGIRATQGKALETLGKQDTALALILERLPARRGDGE